MSKDQRLLYGHTNAGRSGFSVTHFDHLFHERKLLVKNLFTLDRIDRLEAWLPRQIGQPVRLGWSNSSGRCERTIVSPAVVERILLYVRSDDEFSQTIGGMA